MRDRKTLINHIRAAVDWLKEADHSLSNKDDVSGDLKLMLAEAEIQRAKERVPISRRTKRIINAVAIMLGVSLAFGTWFLLRDNPVEKNEPTTISEKKETVVTEEKIVEKPNEEPAVEVSKPADNKVGEEKAIEPKVKIENPPTPKEEPAKVQEPPTKTDGPPTDEMQKLMESAGKVLRK